ncbi:MAG: flagellar assembly peptidoglycan hydrolase FlgJ [Gammaproteobacteria bacterium]|nr:flagellar assembly peptidoglycan hydrolase FlgJ [Gammaproteobacteria bacterium]
MQTSNLTLSNSYLEQDVYTDLSGLSQLKHQAKDNPEQTLKAVAKQFEALFMQMMLKSMRDASFGDQLFDSDQTQFYQDMSDKQLSLTLSKGQGMGLAAAFERQLKGAANPVVTESMSFRVDNKIKGYPLENSTVEKKLIMPDLAVVTVSSEKTLRPEKSGETLPVIFSSPEEFVRLLKPVADKTATKLGLDANILLAQAALETGWGRHVSQHTDGTSSHNLFNIKAGRDWNGDHVAINTLEYRDGIAQRERAAFRSYPDYESSFNDYAEFLQTRPRYQEALDNTHDAKSYLNALQDAGYATDPHYADKIMDIFKRPLVQNSGIQPSAQSAEQEVSHAG